MPFEEHKLPLQMDTTQRDEIGGTSGQIITRKDMRSERTEGESFGYQYG